MKQFGANSIYENKVEFMWQNDHVVACDMLVLGEIDTDQLLYYSYEDKQMLIYSKAR